ncbi:MAG TPA: hypothetical protein VGF61_07460 [Candidatus Acidoferrum sp.]|jgi:hypothetical protein
MRTSNSSFEKFDSVLKSVLKTPHAEIKAKQEQKKAEEIQEIFGFPRGKRPALVNHGGTHLSGDFGISDVLHYQNYGTNALLIIAPTKNHLATPLKSTLTQHIQTKRFATPLDSTLTGSKTRNSPGFNTYKKTGEGVGPWCLVPSFLD